MLNDLLEDEAICDKLVCVGNLTSKRKNPKHPLRWNWARPDDRLVNISLEDAEDDGDEDEDEDEDVY